MIIRPMEMKDVPEIMVLEKIVYKTPWSEKMFETEIEGNEYAHMFVMVENEHIIGYAGAWMVSDAATITKVTIMPPLQGRRLGKILLEDLLKRIENNGCLYITLEVRVSNLRAQNLYTSHGFKNKGIRKGYYDDGEDAIVMVKYLPGGEDYEQIYIRD